MGMSSLRRLEGRLRDCAWEWEEVEGALASDLRFLVLVGPGAMLRRREGRCARVRKRKSRRLRG
jgi:hypothetical protein